ncbi:MAG: GyrI-like domain-containing protein, partial [Oleiphilaceae bacterium]|nr:GyrI-like domain-containing protein [Oleiphilaceae bacterium]
WGMGGEYSYDDFHSLFTLWEQFHQFVPRSQESFGTTFPTASKPLHFRYFAAAPVPSTQLDLVQITIPKQRYQVFIHHGKAENLLQTLNYIWGVWMPDHGSTISGIDFERYCADYHPDDPNGRIALHLPIESLQATTPNK